MHWYTQLELAPLRGDTIRALSAPYAMRDTTSRAAKANAGATSRAAK